MTLTEEQREAIRVISKLPMAIGCQLCHPYIMKNYGSHFIVLRAMIDGSSMVEPREGFDLEKNRAAIDSAINSLLCEGWDNEASTVRRLVAEIERLRAENLELQVAVFGPDGIRANQACIIADQAASISELEIEITELKADLEQSEICIRAGMDVIDDQAARIQELESSLDEAETLTKKNAELMNGYLGRIAELEDDLVEERAKYNLSWKDCAYRAPDTYCEKTHNYCTSEDCPLLDEQKTEARRQLQAEGKIGNSEHFTDASKMIWHITEERIGLLRYCLDSLLDAPDIEESPGPRHSIEMLRTMLAEAEQCE